MFVCAREVHDPTRKGADVAITHRPPDVIPFLCNNTSTLNMTKNHSTYHPGNKRALLFLSGYSKLTRY